MNLVPADRFNASCLEIYKITQLPNYKIHSRLQLCTVSIREKKL